MSMLTNPNASKIDMTSSEGKKIFRLASKGIDTKYDLSIDDAEDFYDGAKEANEEFFWGPNANAIPVGWNADDTVKTTKSLFDDKHDLSYKEVEDEALKRWTDNTGKKEIIDPLNEEVQEARIRSAMVGKWIQNSLDADAKRELYLDEEAFTYECKIGIN